MLAHLMNSGLGPYYDGLLHLFVTPEDLLPVIAISLFAGLRGPAPGRAVLFALPAAWLAGTACGRLLGPHAALAGIAAALTVVLGGLVAADARLPLRWTLVLAIALGLLHGAWNGIELARAGTAGLLNALGVATAVFVLAALLAALASSLRAPWSRIVVRVAGSWIAAAALLMLGWSLRSA
jgi:hydrogenase/urease accessory protein HupE